MSESEADLARWFLDAAHLHGWLLVHWRPGQNTRGRWSTPFEGNGWGFPDWYLWHPEKRHAMHVELKAEEGNLTGEQVDCLESLEAAGCEVKVFWPSQRDYILEVLN